MHLQSVPYHDLTAKRVVPTVTLPRGVPRRSRPKPELTKRQEQIVKLVAVDAMPMKQIEGVLGLRPHVGSIYLFHIYSRLQFPPGCDKKARLVRWWIENREVEDVLIGGA